MPTACGQVFDHQCVAVLTCAGHDAALRGIWIRSDSTPPTRRAVLGKGALGVAGVAHLDAPASAAIWVGRCVGEPVSEAVGFFPQGSLCGRWGSAHILFADGILGPETIRSARSRKRRRVRRGMAGGHRHLR